MAIKNSEGERCTPKQKAAEDLTKWLRRFQLDDDDIYTDKERGLVATQVDNYLIRLFKVLGHPLDVGSEEDVQPLS